MSLQWVCPVFTPSIVRSRNFPAVTDSSCGRSFENYADRPVPASETVSFWHIALIITGVSINIAAFLFGSQLGSSLGLGRAFAAMMLGAAVLAALAMLTGYVGASARLSTYMILEFAFGRTGGKLVAVVFALATTGWFGVMAETFGRSAELIAADYLAFALPSWTWIIAGSVVMVGTALVGFVALDRLSWLAVPPMLILLLVNIWMAVEHFGTERLWRSGSGELSFGAAVSAVIGSFMVAVTVAPDLCRYARSPAHGAGGCALAYGAGYPVVLLCAAVPAAITGEPDIMKLMGSLGLGIMAFIVVMLATWTTNAWNLYSATLSASTFIDFLPRWALITSLGLVGTAIGMIGIIERFIPFLLLLGVAIPPVCGIYLAQFFLLRQRDYDPAILESAPALNGAALASWVFAVLVGLAGNAGLYKLTGVPALESLFLGLLGFTLISKLANSTTKNAADRTRDRVS